MQLYHHTSRLTLSSCTSDCQNYEDRKANLEIAFSAAEKAGVDMLLEAEDTAECQDQKSIFTQVLQYRNVLL